MCEIDAFRKDQAAVVCNNSYFEIGRCKKDETWYKWCKNYILKKQQKFWSFKSRRFATDGTYFPSFVKQFNNNRN